MIITFKHKELQMYFERGISSKLRQSYLKRLRIILTRLNTAETIKDMEFSGSGLHALKGDKKNFWSLKVNGNWRIIFRFEEGEVYDVDLIDYH